MVNRPRPTVGPDVHFVPVALTCHSAVSSPEAAHGSTKCSLTPLLVWGLHGLSFKKVIVKFLDDIALYSDYDVHGDLMADDVDPSSDYYILL